MKRTIVTLVLLASAVEGHAQVGHAPVADAPVAKESRTGPEPSGPRKAFRRTSRGLDGRELARIERGITGPVVITTDSGSVEMAPVTFRAFAEDYLHYADSLGQSRLSVGMRGRSLRFVFDYEAATVGLVVGVVLLLLGGGVATRRYRRRVGQLESERSALDAQRRLVEAGREEERLRLAREIHDGPLQDLLALRLQLARPSPDLARHDATLGSIAEHLRDVTTALRSPTLESEGLAAALVELGRSSGNVDIRFNIDRDVETRLHADQRLALFRVAQEALANARRHGAAGEVRMALDADDREAHFRVVDNGRGFNVAESVEHYGSSGHYGLVGVKERAEALGGSFGIQSRPGEGTELRVNLPMRQGGSEGGSSTDM